MAPKFGDIRSLLHDVPERSSWEALCEMLEETEDFEDRLLPYTSELLEHWPASMRRAPRRWIERIAHGERVPQIQIARTLVVEHLPPLGLERLLRLRGLDRVEVLDLHNLRLGDNGASLLGRGHWPHLRRLELGLNDISEAGARAMAASAKFPALRELDLHRNPIGAFGAEALAQTPWFPGLERLNLSACDVRGRGVESLPSLHHVTHLELRWNDLGDRGLDALLALELPALESLDLGLNRLTEGSMLRLAQSASWPRLRHLRLGRNPIGDRGVAHLMRAPFLPRLTTLDLAQSEIGPAGAAALADADLSVRTLILAGNPITDVGAEALAASPGLAGLERLDLHQTELTEVGASALLELRALAHLSVTANPIEGPLPARPGLELRRS